MYMPEWYEIVYRTLIAVVVLFFLTKLLGRRQVSQLSLFEYITGITIGSLAAYISLDLEAKWYMGILSLAVWVGVSYLLEIWTMKSRKIREFIEGSPLVVIRDGNILEGNLKKAKYTITDLTEQLRIKNIFTPFHVEYAILEANGQLSAYLKKEYQPLTPEDIGMHLATVRAPQSVVTEGVISHEGLNAAGKTLGWLQSELNQKGIGPEEIFLAHVDDNGKLEIDLNKQ